MIGLFGNKFNKFEKEFMKKDKRKFCWDCGKKVNNKWLIDGKEWKLVCNECHDKRLEKLVKQKRVQKYEVLKRKLEDLKKQEIDIELQMENILKGEGKKSPNPAPSKNRLNKICQE